RPVRADENPFPSFMKLIVPITSIGYSLSGSGSKQRSDRAPGKIDRVQAVRADQAAVVCLTPPITGEVTKLSPEAFPRAHAGRSKTVRAETAKELMIGPVVSDQAALGQVEIPDFVAWLGIVLVFGVESAGIAVTPVEVRPLHAYARGLEVAITLTIVHTKHRPFEAGQLLSVEVGPRA